MFKLVPLICGVCGVCLGEFSCWFCCVFVCYLILGDCAWGWFMSWILIVVICSMRGFVVLWFLLLIIMLTAVILS